MLTEKILKVTINTNNPNNPFCQQHVKKVLTLTTPSVNNMLKKSGKRGGFPFREDS